MPAGPPPPPPPMPGVNMYTHHCIHGLDLRIYARCYLCRPESPEPQRASHSPLWSGSFTVRCTCPTNHGDNYLGNCPIHNVQSTYTA